MWREINFGKGSRRRVRRVRWKRYEMFSVVLLLLVVILESLFVAWWLTTHSFD